LVENASVNVVSLSECLRSAGDQPLDIVDDTADIVGDPSSRIGRVRALLQDDNVQIRPYAARLRCSGHSRCVAANDHQALF
jgi:hypothetical protein